MKASKIKQLDRDASLAEALARILPVRIGELVALTDSGLASSDRRALHDARIAAKRLRYLLELFVAVDQQRYRAAVAQLKALQDRLGELHDCDVLLELLAAPRAVLLTDDVKSFLEAQATADAAALLAAIERQWRRSAPQLRELTGSAA